MIDLPLVALVIIVIYLVSSIKILKEYERGVIFRLGRLLAPPKGPGLIFVFAPSTASHECRCESRPWRFRHRIW